MMHQVFRGRFSAFLALGACALGSVTNARPAETTQPPAPQPLVLPIAGLRLSRCALSEPASGIRRTYAVPNAHGIYLAYGSRMLLPIGIDVTTGEAPRNRIDQILFGASTTFTMPEAARLPNGPNPVSGVARQPMAGIYMPAGKQGPRRGMKTYRLEMTSSVWEIKGYEPPAHVALVTCLYFHRRPSNDPRRYHHAVQ